MKRRDFLKSTVPAAILPSILNGFSMKAYAASSPLVQALMNTTTDTDHVLVIIQLSGGNDGLNMVIPNDIYSTYYNARANIAIPQNKILGLNGYANSGLHPSMTGLQTMYNEGKLAIVQSVSYPTPNFSHFRATDIWMSASDSNTYVSSGWAGRYLSSEYDNPNNSKPPQYPDNYPNASMTDPLAIQIGSITSLALQGPDVNMGISISDPTSFYNFLNGVQDPTPNTPWGNELSFVRQVATQTQQYAAVVKAAAAKVPAQGAYPSGNDLAAQLKIVAQLIKGGLKTRVYMVSTGGFDNHSGQVVTTDTTTGTHANLMSRISAGIKAFSDDLKGLGIEDRVLGMTFSEFGRRVKSNANYGTDHGVASPLFVFGKNVKSGVLGTSPVISTKAANGTEIISDNVPMQYDFRSVYASVLSDWFCVNGSTLQSVMLNNYQTLPLVGTSSCQVAMATTSINEQNHAGIDQNRADSDQLITNYPNPFADTTKITFRTKGGHTMVQIMDTQGKILTVLTDKLYAPGLYTMNFDSGMLPVGIYYARFQNGPVQQVRPMLKVKP